MKGPARRLSGLVLLALAAACSEPPGERAAAAPPASTDSNPPAPPPAPAPRPTPPALPLTRAEALEPAAAVPLAPGQEAVVDPASRFRVELTGAIPARLVLLDERDAHVTGTATREMGATTTLELTPAPALRPGSKYLLRIEGVDGGPIRLADEGPTIAPVSVPIVAAGAPPPPEPAKKPAKKRRR